MASKLPKRRPEQPSEYPKGKLRDRLSHPDARQKLTDADIVMGTNPLTNEDVALFYGERLLNQTIKNDVGSEVLIARFPVDFNTDDPEVLGAFCVALKGSCCYMGETEVNQNMN